MIPPGITCCQNNPLGINDLKAKLESSSFRKSNPRSGLRCRGWSPSSMVISKLQTWESMICYVMSYPILLALFFIGVSNHIRVSWVFKWCIEEYRDWSLASIEICWAAFAPIRGEFRPLSHPVLQLCGPSSALKSTALEQLLWLLKFIEHIWLTLIWRIWHLTPAGANGISPSLNLAFWLSKIGCKMRDPCQL